MNLNRRYLATITIEATTPLKVGSSGLDMLQDAPVQKDFNNLPMIMGTSIAGVLRRMLCADVANDLLGDDQIRQKENRGSRLVISNALLCDASMQVHETLLNERPEFLKIFDTLITREHTAITDKGVAKEHTKFDEEVIFKGSRFKFRLELMGSEADADIWNDVLVKIQQQSFRLGGGTTKGFGAFQVLPQESGYDVVEITSATYGEKSSSLNTPYSTSLPQKGNNQEPYVHYTLKLTPNDFFMFGSGFGDDDADMTPVYEQIIDYENATLSDAMVLIPASSLKGALSHRTTYHYNLQNKLFSGNPQARKTITELFGAAKGEEHEAKGKLLFSDLYAPKTEERIFDHVSLDRFTGGALEGALFQEKTVAHSDTLTFSILMKRSVDSKAQIAFEAALSDITTGILSLGGATTKGHGIFNGNWSKDEK